jgi:SAM-dependent methyltransferase
LCWKPLERGAAELRCPPCDRADCPGSFAIRDGFPDLIIGDRFEDEDLPDRMEYEEACNEYSTLHYWLPLFERLWPDRRDPVRLLAIGCGVGVEVELLCDAGFDCSGVDCGNRTRFWLRRRHQDGLILGNALHLPFAADTFDGVFCGCVFAHIGVVGDSRIVKPDGPAARQRLADEMARVTKPGGHIVVASPNRLFPLDLFHGRDDGAFKFNINLPGDRFLLSAGDLRRMFIERAGCRRLSLLPVTGFWGFIRARRRWKGWLLSLPVRTVFSLLSWTPFAWLRGSPIAPWITASIQK